MPPSFDLNSRRKHHNSRSGAGHRTHVDSGIILRNNTPVAHHEDDNNSACELELMLQLPVLVLNPLKGSRGVYYFLMVFNSGFKTLKNNADKVFLVF